MPQYSSRGWLRGSALVILLVLLESGAAFAVPRVLMVFPNAYGANANLSRNEYEAYGWNITTSGMTETVIPCGWAQDNMSMAPVDVDTIFTDIVSFDNYDAVIFMTSSGSLTEFTQNSAAKDKIREAIDAPCVTVFHCATIRFIIDVNRISGTRVAAPSSLRTTILSGGGIWAGDTCPPVISGNIVTSMKNMYFAPETADAIARAIEINCALPAVGGKQ